MSQGENVGSVSVTVCRCAGCIYNAGVAPNSLHQNSFTFRLRCSFLCLARCESWGETRQPRHSNSVIITPEHSRTAVSMLLYYCGWFRIFLLLCFQLIKSLWLYLYDNNDNLYVWSSLIKGEASPLQFKAQGSFS